MRHIIAATLDMYAASELVSKSPVASEELRACFVELARLQINIVEALEAEQAQKAELLALVARLAAGNEIEAHGPICVTDPCLRCEAAIVVAKIGGVQ